MSFPVLGIMVLYVGADKRIEERAYFKKLLLAGEKLGLDTYLFTPEDVNRQSRKIHAHHYDGKRKLWVRRWRDFPDLIFDRCRFQRNPRFEKLREFRRRYPELIYLNRPLANKWEIHDYLSRNHDISPHLPATLLVQSSSQCLEFIKKHRSAYYKPINGTGGRGIMQIRPLGASQYLIRGRNPQRKIIPAQKVSLQKLKSKLSVWRANQRYLIQKEIPLQLANGRVHDYRLLVQKNEHGQWEVTGCAGRMGARHSVTSNLHGGGRAVPMDMLLKHWFPNPAQRQAITEHIHELGLRIVRYLQQRYSDMCELALDIAVDRNGHPWLLEINPKPSREVFLQIGENETYRTAIIRPLQYALWLYEHH